MKYTRKDFVKYKKCIEKLAVIFGMVDYELRFKHEPTEDSYAEVEYDQNTRDACFKLTTKELPDNQYAELKRLALHEFLHIVLADLKLVATQAPFDVDRWGLEEHKVINVLIKEMETRQYIL